MLVILVFVFLIIFCVSSLMVIFHVWQGLKMKRKFEILSEQVAQNETVIEQTIANQQDAPQNGGEATILPQYVDLYESNNDFTGWLKIPDTQIDFPIMYTPNDPEYYLNHSFDKKKSNGGTPFIDENSNVDSTCMIIHGHNMKNNTMFGSLDDYKNKEFWDKHKIIELDTLYENREYEVFAAVETRILNVDEEGFRYYNYSGDLTEDQYKQLRDWLVKESIYYTGISPSYDDQILILSTCSYQTENGRFIVAARKIND